MGGMAKSRNERYHDRVAPRYDHSHENDPYLSFCRELTWRHLKPLLPRNANAAVLDAGCGPGYYGIKLAKTGYAVDFLDLSEGMLDAAKRNYEEAGLTGQPRFVKASLDAPDELAGTHYELIVAMGDVLSFVEDPQRALHAVARLLAPGGIFVGSVDQRYAGIEHLLDAGDLGALERFLKDGRSEWLAKERSERFPTRMFTAAELEEMAGAAKLEVIDVIGRPVLPLHRQRSRLTDLEVRRRLLKIEEKLHSERDLLGRASHLEIALRRPKEPNPT